MFKIPVSPPIQSVVNLHRGAWGLCLCLNLPEAFSPPQTLDTARLLYPSSRATAGIYNLHSHSRFTHLPSPPQITCLYILPVRYILVTFLHGAGHVVIIHFVQKVVIIHFVQKVVIIHAKTRVVIIHFVQKIDHSSDCIYKVCTNIKFVVNVSAHVLFKKLVILIL